MDALESGVTILTPQNIELDETSYTYQKYCLAFNSEKIIMNSLHNKTVNELYVLSKLLHQIKAKRLSVFINHFIHAKFNSFIPGTAEIGEGTRFGYGGV